MDKVLFHREIKPVALDLSLDDWKVWCQECFLPAYCAKQIFEWIFQKGSLDPKDFSNLSKACRLKLEEAFCWDLLTVDSHLVSQDGSEKFLLKTLDGHLIEMVVMPYENRATLCVSSQVGCRMGCTFCQTGKMGIKRNLSSGEILTQLFIANCAIPGRRVTNIVFMGMGEPLDNYDNVVRACSVMVDPLCFGLSRSKVTISTCGLVPQIRKLGQDLPLRLAISLHSVDDAKRSAMMPINRKYNLEELKRALLEYPARDRDGITFEYVMIAGVNDSLLDAKRLVRFLHGLKAKMNLIPLNHFPGSELRASEQERLDEFQAYLKQRSIPAPVRYSRGQDVSGGCGQLAAKRKDELNVDPRELQMQRRLGSSAANYFSLDNGSSGIEQS